MSEHVRIVGLKGNTATIEIVGDIGYWDDGNAVDADQFIAHLASFEAREMHVNVEIDSIGGSYIQGLRIAEAIKAYPYTITTVIVGQAYSMASLIGMSAKRREIVATADGMMIHKVWAENVSGTEERLREVADLLREVTAVFAEDYARIGGVDVLPYFDGQDHFFTPDECVALGFCDAVVTPSKPAKKNAMQMACREAMPSDHMANALRACLEYRTNRFPPPAAAAAILPKGTAMTEPVKPQAAAQPAAIIPAAPVVEPQPSAAVAKLAKLQEDDIKAAALTEEHARRAEIRAVCQPFLAHAGIESMMNQYLDNPQISVETARAALLQNIARNAEPLGGGLVMTTEDEFDKFKAAAKSGLMIRAGLTANDRSNEYRGYSLLELARASLQRRNISTKGMDKMAVVAAAFTHSSSDFDNLLADVAHKSMMKGYEEAEETFQRWTSAGTLPDFKAAKRVDLNTFPALAQVAEGAEYKYVTVGDRGETIQLATYGSLFSITRQAIINDDLDAFTRVPNKMGRAAIRTVGNLVYAVLTGNPAMADGVTLFHADHDNLPTSAVLSTASVDAMGAAMATQTDATGNTLNIEMAYVLVPRTLKGLALQVANSEYEVGATSTTKNNTVPNYVRGAFEVIADPRLTGAAWYGAANPNTHDTVEVAYLDGNQSPTLEQQGGWTVDGVEFKVRMDAGVKALDFRGLAKNAGG